MSSVVLNADLVSLVSVVRRGAFAPAAYLGVFVVKSGVVMMEVQSDMRRGWPSSVTASRGDRFASPAGAPCVFKRQCACVFKRVYFAKLYSPKTPDVESPATVKDNIDFRG